MNWLVQSWWHLLHPIAAGALLTATAILCGGLVGAERERKEKPAGMRTLMLVCLGAAVFTMIGFQFAPSNGDTGRVAAQIVTGIGFLGAGVILHERRIVTGTTTAATIWVTASIGIVAGAGFAPAALALAGVVRGVLAGLQRYERRLVEHERALTLRVVFFSNSGKTRASLLRVLADFGIREEQCRISTREDGQHELETVLHLGHRPLRELIDEVAAIDAVSSIEEKPAR
jgi:putative Mg2+ transporter-C (MgtC) family protein